MATRLEALRFLIEYFSEAPEELDQVATANLQREGSRVLTFALEEMDPAAVHKLRHLTRDWLRSFVRDGHVAHRVTIAGPIYMAFTPSEGREAFINGDPQDVWWFHVVQLACAASSEIRVCYAPRAQPKGRVATVPPRACGRLFLRRGDSRQFCSNTCRTRVATQRARGMAVLPQHFEGWDVKTATNVMDVSSRDDGNREDWPISQNDSMQRALGQRARAGRRKR